MRRGLSPDFLLRWHTATIIPFPLPTPPPRQKKCPAKQRTTRGSRRRLEEGCARWGPGRGVGGGVVGGRQEPRRAQSSAPPGAHTYPRGRGSGLRGRSQRAPLVRPRPCGPLPPTPGPARWEGAWERRRRRRRLGLGSARAPARPVSPAVAEAPPPGGEAGVGAGEPGRALAAPPASSRRTRSSAAAAGGGGGYAGSAEPPGAACPARELWLDARPGC